MKENLTSRQRAILKGIIQEYIRTGKAVGSKTLIERYGLSVSPATVRSEMGELEELSYLQHPHTSAGRMPTDLGYRYYVEYLLEEPNIPVAEQIMIRHQFRQVDMQVEGWVKLAAAILANASGNLSLATPPRSTVERLRHFELISLRDHVVLLIVVTQAGGVHEVILQTTESVEQDDLSNLSRRLISDVRNLSHSEIAKQADGAEGLPALLLRHIANALQNAELQSRHEVFSEGLDLAMLQPELSQGPVAHRLLELLRGGAILSALLPQVDSGNDVQIFIGSENSSSDLQSFGVVVATYGAREDVSGLLGVLGPTRMAYGRSITMVRYLTQVLNDLLRGIYDDETVARDELR